MNSYKIITLFQLIILLGIFNSCGGSKKNDTVTDYDSRPIVCFGDSLTYGQGAAAGQTYPDFLQKKVKVPVINAGRNGHTLEDGLKRVNEDVIGKDPQLVIINFGGNDLFEGFTVAEVKKNLEDIIAMLDNGKRKIYVSDWIPDSAVNSQSSAVINAQRMANDVPALTLIELTNYADEFKAALLSLSTKANVEVVQGVLEGVYGDPELMYDHIHPNSRGYEIMADNYFQAIKSYLETNNLLK